ncbi:MULTISPECIES: efflux RND transporter periplasmic adaptor subunit [Dethiosulfovibrio]|uniref:Efflux RND transporter periplasmic adaptor subunit n=1 Tax=Dethiosulfovibrio marinus TaxID=133532 RepID=A0ABS9EQN7_9BACT|nr:MULTISPECIES: efflux RND transporter periplasmic adaptor subunit [Dethiosulfovibrio]MCF4115083.1 efflux RND transporter periplasmic adaptor subunit [Dethiosulfovibrio russensis]MCF4143475.1 efflux RND transporter periplasmic adaptor subunit [Dethiosulfovibrio marinus]
MKSYKKLSRIFPLFLAIALVAVLLGPRFFSRDGADRKPMAVRPVKSEVLRPINGESVRSVPGRVRASKRVDMAFRVSGPLVELPAREGDRVSKGDLLARIDPRDFRLALEQARGALSQARANLDAMKKGARNEDLRSLEAQVASAQARAEEAEAQFRRFERLYQAKVISQSEYDRYRTAKDVAESSLAAARQELRKARKGARDEDIRAMESGIKSLEAREKTAAAALADTELRAPFDGVVSSRMVENYQFVTARQPVIGLQSTSSVEIVADVPESAARLDPEDLDVWASFNFLPGRDFLLKLVEFSSAPDRETQTYRATFSMDIPEGVRLLPGMAVQVSARINRLGSEPVYHIPIEALLSDDRGPGVWILGEKMRAHWTSVEVVGLGDGKVDVSGELTSGDRVVTAGVHSIREGQVVRLSEAAR